MEREVKIVNFDVNDKFKCRDSIPSARKVSPAPILGRVEIYTKHVGKNKPLYDPMDDPTFNLESSKDFKLIQETSNLVVYRGRNVLLTRMFNQDLDYLEDTPSSVFANTKDESITFFSVGTGGADTDSLYNPNAPASSDYELVNHGDVSGGSRWVTINGRQYKRFDVGYPQFLPDDEISNNSEILANMDNVTYGDYKRDTYLVSKVRISLPESEGNTQAGVQYINELGLFLATSNSVTQSDWNSYSKNLNMFARTTIRTVPKDENTYFALNWYIYA